MSIVANRANSVLGSGKIIAAIRGLESQAVLHSSVESVFVLSGEILNVGSVVKVLHQAGKRVFLHVDLIHGLSGDRAGLQYVAHAIGPDGIVTTRSHLIGLAKKEGLITIQRLFVVDSQALSTGVGAVRASNPDALEIMPGVVPKVITEACTRVNIPIIAGGLISTAGEIDEALAAGAKAVSLSKEELWDYRPSTNRSRVARS